MEGLARMMVSDIRAAARVAIVALLAAWVVGCGGTEDASDGDSVAKSSVDEQEIRETLAAMGERMAARDGAGACGYLTQDARRQIVATTRRLAAAGGGFASKEDAANCTTAYGAVLSSRNPIEDLDPRIVSVRVRGDRAVVAARSSHDTEQRQYALLEREDGRWRLALWFARDTAAGRVDNFLRRG